MVDVAVQRPRPPNQNISLRKENAILGLECGSMRIPEVPKQAA